MITVRQALSKYREVRAYQLSHDLEGNDQFLSAYSTPAYTSLPTFLTMYRAYSKRSLLHNYASQIARGKYVHAYSDIRISIPHPKENEAPSRYAERAIKEMNYFHSCLLPSQKLFITFPRQTFNAHNNLLYFGSFIDMLSSGANNNTPWTSSQQLNFDFAGQPLPLNETIPLLEKLRGTFPSAFICYHHGEVCPHIPFSDRVSDSLQLLPYVNRIGHGLCLGLAILEINPDDKPSPKNDTISNTEVIQRNKDVAYQCLNQMSKLNIGIEVSPTCNITLGGARSKKVLQSYVDAFLDCGVNVYVGTDDPGFLGTCLEAEIELLRDLE